MSLIKYQTLERGVTVLHSRHYRLAKVFAKREKATGRRGRGGRMGVTRKMGGADGADGKRGSIGERRKKRGRYEKKRQDRVGDLSE